MATIRLSAIIGSIRGSIGGITFKRTRTGQIVTPRRRRAHAFSPRLEKTRADFVRRQRLWATFTPEQRTAWNSAATSFVFHAPDGQASRLTGFQLWMKFSINQDLIGPPGTFRVPNLNRAVGGAIIVANFTAGGPYNISLLTPGASPYVRCELSLSRPFTDKPVKFFRDYVAIGLAPTINGTSNIFSLVVAQFGELQARETISLSAVWAGTPIQPPHIPTSPIFFKLSVAS